MLIGLEENADHLQQQGQITDDALPSLAAPLGYPAKTRKVGSAIETQVGRIPLNFPFVRRDTQAKTELANWRMVRPLLMSSCAFHYGASVVGGFSQRARSEVNASPSVITRRIYKVSEKSLKIVSVKVAGTTMRVRDCPVVGMGRHHLVCNKAQRRFRAGTLHRC